MGQTVSCGITLYYPSIDSLNHLYDYTLVFNKVYVFDNTENYNDKEIIEMLDKIKQIENIVYITYNKNLGLPKAFNEIIDLCKDDYLCTLDQDSYFPNKYIEQIKNILDCLNPNIAIIAPVIIYDEIDKEKIQLSNEIIDKRYLITSGSFLNLHIIKKEKIYYDEKYFIDKFEIDLCERLKRKNYRIVQYHESKLYQKLGDSRHHGYSTHSAIRHYYLFRNRFYFNKKFYKNPKKDILNFLQTTKQVCMILIYETNKADKLKMLHKAIMDYKNNVFYEYKN